MSVFLRLLSTDHCTLCDEALSMLFSMPDIAGLELRVVDVVSDDELLEKYGQRAPVLQLFKGAESSARPDELVLELAWPFTSQSVGSALRAL